MRKKTEARRLSFVQAAGRLFIEQGFGAVTMEAIAAEAGASKVTLYSYFSGKDELFAAFAAEAGKGVVDQLDNSQEESDLQLTLHNLGMAYLNLVTRPEIVNLNRLSIGEAGRYPHLSLLFYENGPRQTLISICNVMESLMQRGLLRRTELRRTGLYFKALCDAGLVERQLWGLDNPPDEPTRRQAVEAAIAAFLPAHGALQAPVG